MIFAKLDVRAWNHPKFVAAGPAAVGLWCAALAFLRDNESSDGVITDAELGLLLGLGKRPAAKLADRLVEVGLFGRQDGAYVLLRYAAKNETREEIEARRAASRTRTNKSRLNGVHGPQRNTVTTAAPPGVTDGATEVATHGVTADVAAPAVPIGSGSVSSPSEQDPERSQMSTAEADSGIMPTAPPVEPERVPGTGELPDGVVAFERSMWEEAYQRAVRGKARLPAWTFSRKQFGTLRDVVEALCVGEHRRAGIDAWVERDVGEFVADIRARGDDPKFWSDYQPDGLQKWHNRQVAEEAEEPAPPEHPLARARPEDRPMSADETAKAATAALAAMGNIGRGGRT